MDPQRLFRKAALEKLSSPERLDELMQVTSPAAWLCLSAIGLALIAVIVWSVVGSISIKVRGMGILLRGEALHEVTSGAYGRVSEILVDENETVKRGEVVARLEQPELDEQIKSSREQLESLMEQAENERRSQRRILNRLEAQNRELQQTIKSQEVLVEKGLLTQAAVMPSRQQLTATEQEMARIKANLAEQQNRIESARHELDQLTSQHGLKSEVVCHFDGKVLEIAANIGDLMSPGNRILVLEAFSEPIDAVIFIPAADGKKVRPGMRAQIAPSTVRTEEWGFIIGEVSSVSDFPASPEALKKILRNEQLVSDLTGRSAPIEVVAKLLEDESTPSGFKWSSSQGPPVKVFSGTVCQASVTVERKRPISYVLPILRQAAGLS